MSNLDAALSSLAAEVNELEGDRKSGNNSKQVAMGHKLIAIRELLRERNGINFGSIDRTGNHAPKGWEQWVKDNLTISLTHARNCVQFAVDPEGMRARDKNIANHGYNKNSARKIQLYINKLLPYCTQDEKERILNTVYNSFKKADTA